MPELQYVVVPWIYRNLDPDRVVAQTDAAMDDIVRELNDAAIGKKRTRRGSNAETIRGRLPAGCVGAHE